MIIAALLIPLAMFTAVYIFVLVRAAIARHSLVPLREALAVGGIANFFDTLGIGSFAPTMAWFKFRGLVPDRLIPATMLAGYSLPTITQAAIFLVLLGVSVDPLLLLGCIVAMSVGGIMGVSLVARLPIRIVQGCVGFALLLAALLFAMSNLDMMPLGGDATGLAAPWFYVAIAAHVVMGILASFGIGSYAPTLIMLSLMGMDPRLAFPIMASAGAFGMLAIGTRQIATPHIDLRIVIGLALGGIPAVLVAAFIVKEMPIEPLRWLVVVVVLYAAGLMLRSAFNTRSPTSALS